MEARLDIFEDAAAGSGFVDGQMTVAAGKTSTLSSSSGTAPVGSPNFNTLDEPIKETVLRDIRAVGTKFLHVLYPKENPVTLLKEWDLWGPLILCTFMATILQGSSNAEFDGGPEFAQVFVIVWIGSAIVTLNSKLLGGNISFFQSVCVLGYCLTPIMMALLMCKVILVVASAQTKLWFTLRLITTMGGFAWATYAAFIFLGDSQPKNRKPLAVYPIFLFYFVISWLVISHST